MTKLTKIIVTGEENNYIINLIFSNGIQTYLSLRNEMSLKKVMLELSNLLHHLIKFYE